MGLRNYREQFSCRHLCRRVEGTASCSFQKHFQAFSLVEILVAIVILSVLALIVVNLLGNATYAAHKTQSIANLRSIGGSLASYVADHNGNLPEGGFRPTLMGTTMRYWFNALDYYMGGEDWKSENWKNTNRPAWQVDPLKEYSASPVSDASYAVNVGYGWNHSYFGYTPSWYPERTGWGSKISEVEMPSHTIIVGTNSDTDDGLGNALIYPSVKAAKRYKGAGLYLLLDGRVDSYTYEQILENDKYLFKKTK